MTRNMVFGSDSVTSPSTSIFSSFVTSTPSFDCCRGYRSRLQHVPGSAARYGHDKTDNARKLTAEGIEALKEVSGSTDAVLGASVGGVQSGMGYLGAATLPELRTKARYIRVSPAGQKEAAPHDVIEVSTRTNNA